MCPIFLIKPQS